MLLNQHKNRLFKAVEQTGIPVTEFEWQEYEKESRSVFELKLKNSPLRFTVKTSPHRVDRFVASWVPWTEPTRIDRVIFESGEDIETVSERLRRWISEDIAEILKHRSEPDLWALAAQWASDRNSQLGTAEAAQQFSQSEKEKIRAALLSAKKLIVERTKLTPEQATELDSQFAYANQALDRMGRFDWKNFVWGLLGSTLVNMCVDRETGRAVVSLLEQAMSAMLPTLTG